MFPVRREQLVHNAAPEKRFSTVYSQKFGVRLPKVWHSLQFSVRDKRNSERFVVSQRLKVSIMFSQHAGKFKEKMTLTSNSLIYSSGILL